MVAFWRACKPSQTYIQFPVSFVVLARAMPNVYTAVCVPVAVNLATGKSIPVALDQVHAAVNAPGKVVGNWLPENPCRAQSPLSKDSIPGAHAEGVAVVVSCYRVVISASNPAAGTFTKKVIIVSVGDAYARV
jgi:hypothetical protein